MKILKPKKLTEGEISDLAYIISMISILISVISVLLSTLNKGSN